MKFIVVSLVFVGILGVSAQSFAMFPIPFHFSKDLYRIVNSHDEPKIMNREQVLGDIRDELEDVENNIRSLDALIEDRDNRIAHEINNDERNRLLIDQQELRDERYALSLERRRLIGERA